MISTDEQETTISFSRNGDECSVYTSDSTMMTKLDKLVEKSDKWRVDEVYTEMGTDEIVGKVYITSKKLISFRTDRVKQEITDEQKEARRERMKKLNEQKHQN